MNGFTLIAVIVVTCGAVAIFLALHLRKAWTDTATQAKEGFTRSIEPVARGVAEICHSIARRIETRRDELKALREQIATLTSENEQLKNRHISVDRIERILKIAFLEADFSETNFVKRTTRKIPGTLGGRDEEIEYLGVYQATNTQRLGVDVNSMKFRLADPANIEVAGFGATEIIGNLNTQIKPLHTELRRHLTGGALSESHEIVNGDIGNLLLDQDRAQRDQLYNTITKNKAVEQVDRTLEQMTLQFLIDYFHPRGYTVKKAVGDLPDGKSLFELSADLNSNLDHELRAKTRLLTETTAKRAEVEIQIARDIEDLKTVGTRV